MGIQNGLLNGLVLSVREVNEFLCGLRGDEAAL
jgi:hypothetical protein